MHGSCMDMHGNMTQVWEISLHVYVDHISSSVEYTYLVLFTCMVYHAWNNHAIHMRGYTPVIVGATTIMVQKRQGQSEAAVIWL